jgi:large subunit ribosomal protein L15
MRDTIKKFPKHRGYAFKAFAIKPSPVNLDLIESTFDAGAIITPDILLEKKLINRTGGRVPKVKILSTGKLTKKVTITGCLFSLTAKSHIEAVGGTIN